MEKKFSSDELPLAELLERAARGDLQLPDFQRGWVWDDDHIRSLLVSISLSYPIGAVMTLVAGAGYGVTLLWAILFSVAATAILQDMAARVGLTGRRGLAEAIRDSLAKRWIRVGVLGLITGTILLGNTAFQTGNLIGAALGLNLLSGLPTAALALSVGGLAAGC